LYEGVSLCFNLPMRQHQRKPNTDKHLRRQVVHIDESMHIELQRVRAEIGIPIAVQIRQAIESWLKEGSWLRVERR
jgi:hypothetical protein